MIYQVHDRIDIIINGEIIMDLNRVWLSHDIRMKILVLLLLITKITDHEIDIVAVCLDMVTV